MTFSKEFFETHKDHHLVVVLRSGYDVAGRCHGSVKGLVVMQRLGTKGIMRLLLTEVAAVDDMGHVELWERLMRGE